MQMVRKGSVAGLAAIAFIAVAAAMSRNAEGQGSTVQGDILRGEGQFLRGKGLYDYYSARGRRIDAGTEIMIQKWNAQVYAAYVRERSAHIRSRKNLTNAQVAEAQRRMAEKEERLRTEPTDADVVNGDALNALLVDLSDPSIASSSWRAAPVPLPEGISIRSLLFRFAPTPGERNSAALSNNLIALGRLDPSRGWPLFLPAEKVGAERRAYEAAHRRLLERCEKGELSLDDVTALDRALGALRSTAYEKVPQDRNFRIEAMRYLGDMQAATKIFDASTIDFAQEMIRDTHDYNPQTVGELLAFLRKYRLLFASAAGRPEDGETYRQLFELLRKQKTALGLKPVSADIQHPKLDGTWVLRSMSKDGQPVHPPKEAAKRLEMQIEQGRFTIANGTNVVRAGKLDVNPSNRPGTIERTLAKKAKGEDRMLSGIYELNGDTLRICWGRSRPDGFRTSPGDGRLLQVWVRQGR